MSNTDKLLKLLQAAGEKQEADQKFWDKIDTEKHNYLVRLQVLREADSDAYSNFPGVRGKMEMQLHGLATTDADYANLVNKYQQLLNDEDCCDWEFALREAIYRCNMLERYAEDIDLCSCINKLFEEK